MGNKAKRAVQYTRTPRSKHTKQAIPKVTPSMDDKATPSPPTRDNAKYLADMAAGINPIGKPRDKHSIAEDKP